MGYWSGLLALAASTSSPMMPRRGPLVEERVSPGCARALDEDPQAIFGRGRAPAWASARSCSAGRLTTTMGRAYAVLRAYRGDTLIYIASPTRADRLGALSARAEAHWTLGQAVDLRAGRACATRLMIYRRNVERPPPSRARSLLRVASASSLRRHRPLRLVLRAPALGARAAGRKATASSTCRRARRAAAARARRAREARTESGEARPAVAG